MTTTADRPPVTVAELVAAITEQRRGVEIKPQPASKPMAVTPTGLPTASTVLVVGGHPGSGTSSVAVAIADALAARSETSSNHDLVRLVDAAPQETSGLICAADRELGVDGAGWRIGRRGMVEVQRPSTACADPDELPTLACFNSGWLVVDAGRPVRALSASVNPIAPLLAGASLVLVCRASVPGVRRAELALGDLPKRPVVVVVGARRLSGEVQSSFGPLLREATGANRVALLPADRRLEVSGIDARPLPRAVAAAATRLLDLIWPETPAAAAAERAYRTKG